MNIAITGYYSRIRYFTSPSERPGEANNNVSGNCSVVVGGGFNTVSNYFSAVLGGYNNTNSGYYSSILGGYGNNIAAGYSYVGMFGNGLSACSSDTFHVSCLNAINTPAYAFQPPGSVVYIACGSVIPFGAKALYII